MKKHQNHAGTRHDGRKAKMASAKAWRKLHGNGGNETILRLYAVPGGHLKPGQKTRLGIVQRGSGYGA